MIKNIICSCFIIFVHISCKQDMAIVDSSKLINDWHLISANNIDYYVDKIFFLNPKIGWIAGNGGIILTTINGGNSWHNQNSSTTKNLTEIFFINENQGWTTGFNNTFLYTFNGGNNWQQINVCDDTTKHNTDIHFIDDKNGWLLNNYGEIFKTNDGGTTWNKIFIFPNFGWTKLKFIDNSDGYAMQFYGDMLMKTSDGGKSWREVPLFIPGATLGIMVKDIFFVNRFIGFYIYSWRSGGIMETATPLMKTLDSGDTWAFQDSVMNPLLRNIYFTDTDNGILAGSNFIYSTNDSGKKWSCCATLNETDSITDIYFYDNKNGWALCSNGNVYKNSH
jgi:photosystem II stability/assembly factor-like uncharacterized protein